MLNSTHRHIQQFMVDHVLTRFPKIAIPNNNFQMANGQGSHWLIESPTIFLSMCSPPLSDIYLVSSSCYISLSVMIPGTSTPRDIGYFTIMWLRVGWGEEPPWGKKPLVFSRLYVSDACLCWTKAMLPPSGYSQKAHAGKKHG